MRVELRDRQDREAVLAIIINACHHLGTDELLCILQLAARLRQGQPPKHPDSPAPIGPTCVLTRGTETVQ